MALENISKYLRKTILKASEIEKKNRIKTKKS